jgi:3-oxoadipate enol-lactonase
MPFAAVNNIEIYYEVHGDGPPLLAISGSGNDLRHSQASDFPLNRSHTVAHYDQRGLGQTTVADGPYSMEQYADDAAGLLDALGWERASVIGTSFGGMVAQNLAVRHPGRIDKLILACTSSGGAGGASADLLAMSELPEAERAQRSLQIMDTRYDPSTGELPPGIAKIMEAVGSRGPAESGSERAKGERLQLQARGGHDTFHGLREFTRPTLVIGGRYDGIAPPANLEAIAGQLPNAQLVLCQGGHAFMAQDLTSWATIAEFLGREVA